MERMLVESGAVEVRSAPSRREKNIRDYADPEGKKVHESFYSRTGGGGRGKKDGGQREVVLHHVQNSTW